MIALASISKNWIIGDSSTNKIPFHIKEDLRWFKEKTWNKNILVGQNTFSELPRLKNRKVFVFTSSDADYAVNKNGLEGRYLDSYYIKWNINNVHKEYFNKLKKNLIICGGAKLYDYFIPQCSELFLTLLDFEVFIDKPICFPYSLEQINKLFKNKKEIKKISQGEIWYFYNEK